MRWAIVLAWLASGCFNPSAQPGSPCGENGACPGSLVCVNGTCDRSGTEHDAAVIEDATSDDAADELDAMIDAMPLPLDNDGDGVPDAMDNCVNMANADQHDEDNDSVGDVCDNCPHVANANQANVMDNDTVGDACDPNPTLNGDSIVRFLPMHVVPPMITTTGTWQQMGDSYVHTNNQAATLIVQGGPWSRPTIVIGGKQEANIVPHVVLGATIGEGAEGYVLCGYFDEASSGKTDFHRSAWGPGVGTNWDFWDAPEHFAAQRLTGTFTIRLQGNTSADNIICTTTDSRGTIATGTEGVSPLTPGNVGIRSEGITYSISYIVVFNR